MKKLLSLLSTITIAGSGITGIVGNAPTPAKNEVNYSQINNLENLKRIKKQINNIITSYFIAYNSYDARQINEITGSVKAVAVYQNNVSDSVKANSLYFATTNGLYFMYHNSWTPHKINGINEEIVSITIAPSGSAYAITKTGKSYFIAYNSYDARQINEITGSVKAVAVYQNNVSASVKANSLYFATTNGLYFMYHNSWTPHKINGINEEIVSITIAPSGSAYAITKTSLNNIIKITNLLAFNKNTDRAILNELNYLNPNLDISQLEVKEKNDVSATIRAKSNSDKYFGEKKIYYSINNQENKIIF